MNARRTFLAHGTVRPLLVGEVVRSVRTSLRATHAVESLLLFVAGTLTARCAALYTALPPDAEKELMGVSLLCGALCAAAWWLEHPVEAGRIARALDQRLRYHGALLTAYDLEERRAAGARAAPRAHLSPALTSMERLVCWRVLERLRVPDALRVLFPPLFVPIAAPTLAGLCLVLLVDARRSSAPQVTDFRALAGGLAHALALGALDPELVDQAGEDPGAGLSREQQQGLAAVLGARSQLPYSDEDWTRAPEETRAKLDGLDRELAELAARVDPASELHERLDEARTWLDALRMGLDPADPGRASPAAQGSPAGDGTAASGNGTISRPPPAPERLPMVPDSDPTPASSREAGPPTPALGVQAGTWWPVEYDAVVERWVELSRTARGSSGARQGSGSGGR